ncbi:hypothetical protein [Pseudomonas sp. R76]|uniref:hypothetical protein n=1 Tax=Pseudomonas sp. R76 TaxID=1573711 RepID=UPI00135BA1DB|nr:hypothetical protein [Pseudomonas sp. R76]
MIAIDIGSNVGVLVGQEFKVFHPTFSGKMKFSVNDGRTTRTLGTYPRVESARITVFNSQPEISFAVIDSTDEVYLNLEPGCHLEAIPAGSIGHLLSNASKYFASPHDTLKTGDINSLQEFIASSTKEAFPFATVIRFTREPDYLKKYGTAALNKALAKLYRCAQSEFTHSNLIAILDTGSICIVGPDSNYSEKKISNIIKEINSDLPSLEVIAGICCNNDVTEWKELTNSKIDKKGIIELARFSASEKTKNQSNSIIHFTLNTTILILQELHKTQLLETAYTDFKRLVTLGVDAAPIYNLGGLLASGLGMPLKSLENYHAACQKDPTLTTYKTNYATAALKLDEVELGLKVLNTLTDADIENIYKAHPYGFFAYTALLAKAKLYNSPAFNESRFKLMAERAISLTEISGQLQSSTTAIQQAMTFPNN